MISNLVLTRNRLDDFDFKKISTLKISELFSIIVLITILFFFFLLEFDKLLEPIQLIRCDLNS